mmetsp:Transcript_29656/g.61934  ORF Transcript_29656/g.61934 Transcript_29656/m.61934 type:complete len:226 (+) Transcript_29656:246-923(+)
MSDRQGDHHILGLVRVLVPRLLIDVDFAVIHPLHVHPDTVTEVVDGSQREESYHRHRQDPRCAVLPKFLDAAEEAHGARTCDDAQHDGPTLQIQHHADNVRLPSVSCILEKPADPGQDDLKEKIPTDRKQAAGDNLAVGAGICSQHIEADHGIPGRANADAHEGANATADDIPGVALNVRVLRVQQVEDAQHKRHTANEHEREGESCIIAGVHGDSRQQNRNHKP